MLGTVGRSDRLSFSPCQRSGTTYPGSYMRIRHGAKLNCGTSMPVMLFGCSLCARRPAEPILNTYPKRTGAPLRLEYITWPVSLFFDVPFSFRSPNMRAILARPFFKSVAFRVVTALIAVYYASYLFHQCILTDYCSWNSGPSSLAEPIPHNINADFERLGHDRITLVMVWKGLNRPNHVDWFLRSIEANKKHTDLLFVAIQDIHNNNRCVDLGPVGDNIKFMCVDWTDCVFNIQTFDENTHLHVFLDHAWHADYLCGAWGCSQEQFDAVLDEIVKRSPQDIVSPSSPGFTVPHTATLSQISSFYRIFRGPIFSRFFLSQTRYWGWCDADTIMGSFERTFPWDTAREMDMDVIQPTHTENGPEILVYLRCVSPPYPHAAN